jgi:hypothetical protein
MSEDSFTETTTKSWFTRIGESIKGILIGLVLVVGSAAGLFWNEGRAVQTERSLTEGAGLVVSIANARVDPALEGKLVHVSGDARTTAPLVDSEFGVSAQGLKLVRHVEMYQWKEESKSETRRTVGGSEETVTTYSYVRTWSNTRIDSSRFRRPEGHANPEMRYRDREIAARDATLGAFRLGDSVLQRISASDEFPLDPALAAALRQRVGGSAQVTDGRFYIGADPASPRIGDLRVSYTIARVGPVSVVGRQTGADFAPYQAQAGDQILLVAKGAVPAADMFKSAQAENRLITWIIRGIGTLAMFFGWSLIWRPFVVIADFVPLFGTILGAGAGLLSLVLTAILAPVVIAIAWFWYRPLVSVIVLVCGLVAAFGVSWLAKRRRAARATASA